MKRTITAIALATVCSASIAGASLTVEETNVLKYLVSEDIAVLKTGGGSIFMPTNADGSAPEETTVAKIEKAYAVNELKGNKAYKGKLVVINGKAEEVSVGAFGGIQLALKASNPYLPAMASFKEQKGQQSILENLGKGSQVQLLCECKGTTAGFLRFEDCQFTKYLAQKAQRRVDNALAKFDGGTTHDKLIDGIIRTSVQITGAMTEKNRALCKTVQGAEKAYNNSLKTLKGSMEKAKVKNEARLKELGL